MVCVIIGTGSLFSGIILDARIRWPTGSGLPVGPQSTGADVRFLAAVTGEWSLVRVDALVQFQMHQLSKRGRAYLANERFVAGMQPRVSFKVRSGTKSFLTHIAFVWTFSGMHVVVFL